MTHKNGRPASRSHSHNSDVRVMRMRIRLPSLTGQIVPHRTAQQKGRRDGGRQPLLFDIRCHGIRQQSRCASNSIGAPARRKATGPRSIGRLTPQSCEPVSVLRIPRLECLQQLEQPCNPFGVHRGEAAGRGWLPDGDPPQCGDHRLMRLCQPPNCHIPTGHWPELAVATTGRRA